MSSLRDVDAATLVRLLRLFNYVFVRQKGSHIRLRSEYDGKIHALTIPDHSPIKIGTLQSILSSVAVHVGLAKSELIERLFPR
jgi:predicted RNA binding protein YcfA (HicA-like mRNA interferase family)